MNRPDEQDTMREEYDFSGGVRGKHYKLLVDKKTDFPLFESVMALDEAIRARFPRKFGGGTEWLGLMFTELAKLENGGYSCTPTNTLAFASTGVDGEHFSFLVGEGRVSARSPIICTAPMSYDDYAAETHNAVVADNFLTFVRLWLRFGGCALVDLAYNPKQAQKVYTTADWKQVKQPLRSPDPLMFDYIPDDETQEVLKFALDALGLQPYIYTANEFSALQQRYMPQIEMSEEYKKDMLANELADKLWRIKQAEAKSKLKRSPDPAAE
jgi:hypothetical protein